MVPSQVIEWIWRRDALTRARVQRLTDRQRLRIERAHAAAELAERALNGLETTSSNDATALLGIQLYGQSVYWAVASLDDAATREPAELFAAPPSGVVEEAADGCAAWETLRDLFTRSAVALAGAPVAQQDHEARLAKQFVTRLLAIIDERSRSVGSLVGERILRVTLLAMGVVVLAMMVRLAVQPTNLAAGKPWRASSSYGNWSTEGVMNEARRPFFATKEQNGPWLEIDLQQPHDVGGVIVENRADCCGDRAVPLIVETSTDQVHWIEAARQGDTFSRWKARFSPRVARWIRLRVPRVTLFHLDDVQVLSAK